MRRRLATLVATVAWGLCSTAGAQHLDVAVLAPTSGDFSTFGDRVTRQVGVAAADAGGVEFRVFDTAEDPARAWRDAVAAGARVIVGPVGELETRAVLAARDEAGSTVPILVLAPVDGLGDVSASVFRARTTQGDQARAVLEALLDKYVDEGIVTIENRKILQLKPFDQIGTPIEIIKAFGGVSEYESALQELQTELYRQDKSA